MTKADAWFCSLNHFTQVKSLNTDIIRMTMGDAWNSLSYLPFWAELTANTIQSKVPDETLFSQLDSNFNPTKNNQNPEE